MTLLSDARHGRRDGLLPWRLLILGSSASLAANVAVADPTVWSRIIHAWPSFALIGAYELLMCEFRTAVRSVRGASAAGEQIHSGTGVEEHVSSGRENEGRLQGHLHVVPEPDARTGSEPSDAADERQTAAPSGIQVEAWMWALENRRADGSLLMGEQIAVRFGCKERWGRLIKQRGQQGRFEPSASVVPAVPR
ncbi:hypothetical protein [Nocardiopsis sp. FIRDI 009]|uniref:hypothetical protein n=1 Tax=Nocardiopsis sp. FIRDI 009 TaxID=714197 RepID=UPI0018E567BD|nr:hypothetical protein [Nocardiopsis sp. FIRDI 009]